MKITAISYQKTYSIGPYLTDKIGVEASVDDDDLYESVLIGLKERADLWHKIINPHLYTPEALILAKESPVHIPPKEYNLKDESTEISIENAKTMEELAAIKPQCNTKPLTQQYMAKLKQLSK